MQRLLRQYFQRQGIGTQVLFGLCAFNALLVFAFDRRLSLGMFDAGPSLSAIVALGGIVGQILEPEPWRYLSAVFVHFGLLHLGINMLSLRSLGRVLEPGLGAARFVFAFLLTGIAGFLASRFWYGPISPPTAGASGGLFGLMGVEIGVLWALRRPETRDFLMSQLGFALGFALLFPMNNAAHLGGFVLGIGLGRLFAKERRWGSRELLYEVLAAAGLLLTILSVVLSLWSVVSGKVVFG